MEKRRDERVKKRMSVTVNDKVGFVVDMSQSGIQLLMSSVPQSRDVSIRFQTEEKSFELQGVIKWIRKQISQYQQYQVGILLTNACYEYYQLIEKPM